jgi:RNA polymerase sigma-70 factor, ECF subfamily
MRMKENEFTRLALSYLEEVTAYARRLSRTAWDGDDLVQATFEQAFRRWRDLREPARCRAWLFRIARNLHLDRRRATHARPELRLVEPGDLVVPEPAVPAEAVERLNLQELEAALVHLSEEQREAVLLCDLWGFHYEEIAHITAVPVGTVRSRIARGRAALSERLAASHRHPQKSGVQP